MAGYAPCSFEQGAFVSQAQPAVGGQRFDLSCCLRRCIAYRQNGLRAILDGMYYPQQQKEPSGCMETLLITRIVFGMLLIPFAMILAAIAAVIISFWALTIHPLLALVVIGLCGSAFVAVVKWETARVRRQLPPEDRD